MSNLLLNGNVDHSQSLREEVENLRRELSAKERELAQVRNHVDSSLAEIRRLTLPFYRLLQSIHGEIESLGVTEEAPTRNGKWEHVKKRLAPRLVEAIDILLVQGTMRRTQLAAAMKMDYSNCVRNVVGVLIRQGLMVDNGRELSLKELQ